MKRLGRFLRKVAASRLGWLLAVLNLCFVAYEHGHSLSLLGRDCVTVAEARAAQPEVLIASPIWVVAFTILNLPSLLPGALLVELAKSMFPQMCTYTVAYMETVSLAVFGFAQWQFVGYGLERVIRRRRGAL